jgi:O-antigen/teichoic acid export membrane protein
MFIFSPYIFALIFGEAWRVAGEYARILAIETYIGFIFSTVDSGALIVGATNYIAFWHVLRLSINLIIAAISYTYDIRFESYLYLQTISNSSLYLIDIFAQYKLSSGCKFHTQE